MISCMFHDKINDYIIVAGNSSSDDYVMGNINSLGIVYALDIESNWMWGMYYLWETLAINTISGCI